MSRFQTSRRGAWARRRSLSARILGEPPANDAAPAPEAEHARAHENALEAAFIDEEPPFDPPDEDDEIFLGAPAPDFGAPANDDAAPQAPPQPTQAETAQPDLSAAAPEAPPPAFGNAFDEPEGDEPPLDEAHDGAAADEPPFDAPEDEDEAFAPILAHASPAPAQNAQTPAPPSGEAPAPPIHIHACWDRPEIGALLGELAGDHRLARADIDIARGGIDSAIMRFAGQPSPNLLIIDTTLRRAELLAALDRLAQSVDADCKIIILGGLNDITLLRELAVRGVSEYIVPPLKTEDLARAVCRLYAQNDQSRVIAVIGARGGVGASTIAHNLAWSIAERQDACTALFELDLAFGAAAFNIGKADAAGLAAMLADPASISDETLARAAAQHTKHLQIVRAPASLERDFELAPQTLEKLVYHARRANPYVVLDLPHAWHGWVRRALAGADEIVLVAGPDLASLRNAKAMLEALAPLRAGKSAPLIALSMVGAPKRPEINSKDFADAVGAPAAAQIAFDPMLFGLCETTSQMIGQAAPESKAAAALDALAAALTGRKPVLRKRAAESAILARDAAADFAKSPKRGLRDLAPAANDNVLVLTRETSIGNLAASFAAEPESEYLAKARQAAQGELDAQTAPQRRFPWAPVGAAAALAGLALAAGGLWRAPPQVAAAPLAAEAATPAAPASQFAAALLLLGEGRAGEALPLVQGAAQAGFAPAQHRLAQMYERGDALARDPALARAWTERAAANGNVAAMHDLGAYYAQGDTERDAAAAFRWFRQAAEFGLADSQYNLGVLYHEGRGVRADAGEALFWFYLAGAQGDSEAAAHARQLAAAAPAELAAQAQARARAFEPRTPSASASTPL